MGFFDTFLSKVDDADKAVLAKYPDLAASVNRMEDDLTRTAQYAGSWVNWQKENWDPTPREGFPQGMPRAEVELRARLSDATARLSQAMISGTDAEDVAALRKDFEAKLNEVKAESAKQVNGMNFFYQATATRLLPHKEEFGEYLDPQKLMQFMSEKQINDPDVAYDKMMAPRRVEIAAAKEKERETKRAAELETARTEGYQKRAQEVAMGPGGMLPTDGSGGIVGVTARADNKPAEMSEAVKSKFQESKLGDGSLAALGYEMYRRGELPVQ